jgi:hypothetical protein
MILVRIISFLVFEGVGFSAIYWNRKFLNFFGYFDFAEKWLGGTDNLYKLLGLVFMIMGVLSLVGVLDPLWNAMGVS